MFRSVSILHLMLITLTSGMILFVTVAIQQTYRNAANDPQLQMASDLAANPGKAAALVAADSLNLYTSQSVFAIFLNEQGTPITSTCNLNGKTPLLPAGVLSYAKEKGINVLTWEPKNDVRIALVVRPVKNGGFIAVGRSLKFTEECEDDAYLMGGIAWVLAMILIGLSWFWQARRKD